MQFSSYLCDLALAVSSKIIETSELPKANLIDRLLSIEKLGKLTEQQYDILDLVTDYAVAQITSLDEGADYIELASPEKIELAYATKASALQVIGVAVYFKHFSAEEAVKLVISSISHEYGMSNNLLSVTVFKLASLLCLFNDEIGGVIIKYFSHFITIRGINASLVQKCADTLVFGLKTLSQDVVVSTIYTFINLLSVDHDSVSPAILAKGYHDQGSGSVTGTDDTPSSDSYSAALYRNAITAVVTIASKYGDPQIAGLASTVLNQKLNSSPVLDREVALGMTDLVMFVNEKEFRTIWKSFTFLLNNSFKSKDNESGDLISDALYKLSTNLDRNHYLYDSYLAELLQAIVNRGDVHELEHHRPHVEISATANEISIFLAPLATLLPGLHEAPYETTDNEINDLFRNAWFNMVVHGFSKNSDLTAKYKHELEVIARSTPPLVSEVSTNKIESELELNTVLQRGSSHHNVNNQKEIMESITSSNIFDFRNIQYPKLMFLSATVLLESLRANTGNCSKALLYFGDPGIRNGETRRYMAFITMDVVKAYISNVIKGGIPYFAIDKVAAQLKEMFPSQWPFGGNKLKLRADVDLLSKIAVTLKSMYISTNSKNQAFVSTKRDLLLYFMADELAKMTAWLDPLQTGPNFRDNLGKKLIPSFTVSVNVLNNAWEVDPVLAVNLAERFKSNDVASRLETLIGKSPLKVVSVPEALPYFLRARNSRKVDADVDHQLVYWARVSPIDSINLFLPSYHADSLLLQYAMRSLESHDVDVTFFYVPQLVQSLRYDVSGYVEQYILETAQISQLFAHQIIWNILANLFKGEDLPENTVEDVVNPILERVINRMTSAFKDEDREFYEREFTFFNTVTGISRSLMPFLRKTKAEKKAKIDEEIAKIVVDEGVYLPSNPDGDVVDIDRKSGKPLQSHAKTPFLATFKIRREVRDLGESEDGAAGAGNAAGTNDDDDDDDEDGERTKTIEVWQSAIFKVGDDCRQDVLALQIISVFRSIFNSYGLDLYVFPYRVTATAPGCGVIDVLPNSISRDMLGREAVNGLYEYYTTKHGGEDSIQFQRARNNFVKSLAAYSVISYLIQFKDRHNGNIMYDDQGHILHIDFGFCFDIVPGGVKFEAAPFKLTHEMVAVMGGSTTTQAYRWFEELCVKAFLACRPHSETIIKVVLPMLDSGLPCFKGDATIKRLRNRFVLDKSEREAALHFRGLIKKSFESVYTKGYDEFQRITNGIPY
ncbi:hypothetical protein D0Z00_002148 [Geotrichum galactomycetum]|uniref:Uncharacterized protein n=1 Tax=Geotrichum galactomycetum TaxID=27317 RepID=A0ACB6V4Y5_9ASCO|nr:hypothetical protein D0Z00_002148 [Geotrichum candidum]